MRFHKFDSIVKEAIERNQNAVSEAIIKHRIETKGYVDPMDFGCIPDSIDLAKESIKRKEETRMLRAKND